MYHNFPKSLVNWKSHFKLYDDFCQIWPPAEFEPLPACCSRPVWFANNRLFLPILANKSIAHFLSSLSDLCQDCLTTFTYQIMDAMLPTDRFWVEEVRVGRFFQEVFYSCFNLIARCPINSFNQFFWWCSNDRQGAGHLALQGIKHL